MHRSLYVAIHVPFLVVVLSCHPLATCNFRHGPQLQQHNPTSSQHIKEPQCLAKNRAAYTFAQPPLVEDLPWPWPVPGVIDFVLLLLRAKSPTNRSGTSSSPDESRVSHTSWRFTVAFTWDNTAWQNRTRRRDELQPQVAPARCKRAINCLRTDACSFTSRERMVACAELDLDSTRCANTAQTTVAEHY